MITKDVVEVGGKLYNLQHPGNREWIKLKQRLVNPDKKQFELELLLDYCFEHVVFPDDGPKINIDSISLEELEVWEEILPAFLRGKLAADQKGKIPQIKLESVDTNKGSK